MVYWLGNVVISMRIRKRLNGICEITNILLLLLLFIFSGCRREKVITATMAAKGGILFNSVGCTRCHSLSGEHMYGPSLKFIIGDEVTVLRKGRMKNIELDRNYIIRAMTNPDYEKPVGFENKKMARINLPLDEIESIADYLIFINSSQK